jgi:hypothetical protein
MGNDLSIAEGQRKYFNEVAADLSTQAAALVIEDWQRPKAIERVVERYVNGQDAAGDVTGAKQTLDEAQPIAVKAGTEKQAAAIAADLLPLVKDKLRVIIAGGDDEEE